MRYYQIVLSNPTSGKVWQPTPTGDGFVQQDGGFTFTSWANGKNIPGALNVEFDFPVYPFNAPEGNSWITIWGVGLKMLGQAANLNGSRIRLSAGMKPGLPLATAAAPQAGLIVDGIVFRAFGNWQGNNQTLHLVCNPGAAAQANQNIGGNWAAGTPLASALYQALSAAFGPTYKVNVNISSSLILANPETWRYSSLANLSQYINSVSKLIGAPLFGSDYQGVFITIVGNTIRAFDGTAAPAAKPISFQDLIGQPTWIDEGTINYKTVIRSDIAIGDLVQLPKGIQSPYALTSQAAASPNTPASDSTSFQGNFSVTAVHHFGNFRQPDADSWAASFNAIPTLAA